jgi:hypothetical protein
MEDCEWMYSGRLGQGQVTNEWIDKTDAFLERAFGEAAKRASKLFCPCSKCANRKRQTKKIMGGTSLVEWIYGKLYPVGLPR